MVFVFVFLLSFTSSFSCLSAVRATARRPSRFARYRLLRPPPLYQSRCHSLRHSLGRREEAVMMLQSNWRHIDRRQRC